MGKIELLAPAGNFTKLETAFRYGADACYLGGQCFGLRAKADNFDDEKMRKAVNLANSLGKKIYVTLNILSRDNDLDELLQYAEFLYEIGVHGVIVADIGTFMLLRENLPDLPIHVSTQANNLNWKTIEFWLKNGAKRVNLARELSLEEIAGINRKISVTCPQILDQGEPYLEAFVHGAMCMSFSGRCMLSDYMANRSSNRGDCAQPCRWNYYISEEKRPGEYMPIYENERGTFIFNSKDLCMLEHLPELLETGVQSLKIEGRMKSEFYTATIVRAYRIAIDAYENGTFSKELCADLMKELTSVSHRDYWTGFYFDEKGGQVYTTSSYMKDAEFIGTTEIAPIGRLYIRLRGAFNEGDVLEVVPYDNDKIIEFSAMDLLEIKDSDNSVKIERAANAMMLASVKFDADVTIPEGSIVRKKIF